MGAAVFTVGLAVGPALLATRGRPRTARLVDVIVSASGALPGVLLAFGWLLAAVALAHATGDRRVYATLLGSGVVLFAGYAARFLAEAYAPARASLALVDPRWEAAARTLGAGPARVLREITLPAVAPGLRAAALLVAVSVLKELPVTLLLGGPTGLHTLAFRAWDRYNEALLHDAGAAGLLLLATSLIGVWWAHGGER
jgi:iron(III) transport system permease protein